MKPASHTQFVFLSSLHRCTQIKTYSWDNAQVILVGNKCDMEDERVISFERGKQLADSLGLEFFETSAKENINVRVSGDGIPNCSCHRSPADPSLRCRLCSSALLTLSVTRCLRALTPILACSAPTRAPGWTARSRRTSTATAEKIRSSPSSPIKISPLTPFLTSHLNVLLLLGGRNMRRHRGFIFLTRNRPSKFW